MKTFGQHLQELKVRFMVYFAVLCCGSFLGFLIHKPVEILLQQPLNQTLYYSNPAGGLSFVMQIAMGVGLLVSLPVLLYHLVQFMRPAVRPVESRHIILLIACSSLLTILGVAYAYFISMPAALQFLVNFNSEAVKALISVNDYLRFLFAYIFGTVVAFQLPLILFFTNKIRRFPPGGLLDLQRPAIVGSVIFAGMITPTIDPVNQMLVAVPIILLFELGAMTVAIDNRLHRPLPKFEIKMPAELIPLIVPLDAIPTNVVQSSIDTALPAQAKPQNQLQAVPQTLQSTIARPTRRPITMDVFAPAH